jgi:hypothetical protein
LRRADDRAIGGHADLSSGAHSRDPLAWPTRNWHPEIIAKRCVSKDEAIEVALA